MNGKMDRIITGMLSKSPILIKNAYARHKELWLYLVSGGLAMLISIISQYAMLYFLRTPVYINTVVSWLLAASFAFAMAKYQVFPASVPSYNNAAAQALAFFSSRLIVLGLEMAFMLATTRWLGLSEYLMKIAAQPCVIALNYVASRYIFKEKKTRKDVSR